MQIVTAGAPEAAAALAALAARAEAESAEVCGTVSRIIASVRERGWDACREFSLRYDGALPREVSREEIAAALAACDPALRRALERAAGNIYDHQKRLVPREGRWLTPDGGEAGFAARPLQRVGIYVPGGLAAYPSSVLMTAVCAKAAGVGEVVMVTPPTEHLSGAVLAAAAIAGVGRVFAIGGAQAVAALALGAGDIEKADFIAGPGNAYVSEAKRQLYGVVNIDSLAGPSEILIIADGTANAAWVAADLLAQAEHGRRARALLLTVSAELAAGVALETEKQAALLPRGAAALRELTDGGLIILCESLEQACDEANAAAAEHVEIITQNPRELLGRIRHAGAVFLGAYSPEALGDYMAGPSHVLPTGGSARRFSPLSADSFTRKMSVIEYGREHLRSAQKDIEAIARAEGLDAHAASVTARFERL
ncbi:MAG: histidinol dehydrogenase [Oscillospiraceae bacterium]|jgi:histidinol dehydrogenase|nr:histidinol dehydrogenase [Oscillospiraceae bacterium]